MGLFRAGSARKTYTVSDEVAAALELAEGTRGEMPQDVLELLLLAKHEADVFSSRILKALHRD